MRKKLLLTLALAAILMLALCASAFAQDTVPASGRLGTNTIVEGIALPTVIDAESQIQMDDGLIYPSFYFFKDQTTTAWDFSRVTNEDGSDKYTIDNIVKLEIPHGITKMDNLGYRDSNKTTLTHVRIPNTINSNSWNGGFRSTKSLTSVEWEEGYSYKIFGSMFYSCPVENFVIPEGVTAIEGESMCFMGLTSITIPDNVTFIGSNAFGGNQELKEVIISPTSKLETLDNGAFSGLHGLTEPFYFPSSLKELGSGVFTYSYNISEYQNLENTQITVLKKNTFYEGYKFTSISLPSTLKTIEERAFHKCTALESVTFNGNSLTSIGNFAFNGCTSLKSIVIPESVTSFGTDMFNGCSSLKSATLPSNLTAIPYYTFYNCKSLESFTMSDNVTYVGQYAFYNCESLGPVYLSKNIETLYCNGTSRQGVFQNCKKMYFVSNPGDTEKPDVYFMPSTLVNLGSAAFKNCLNLNTTIVFPENMVNLDDDGWNFGNKDQSYVRNFVFLGEMSELKFANENYNTNFYFANKNVTTQSLTLTQVYAPTNCFAYVCSEGKLAQLGSDISWTDEGYAHIKDPNGTKETAATCTMPKMVADYCFCGTFIAGSEKTDGTALGHDLTAESYYVFTSLTTPGKTCIDCKRCDHIEEAMLGNAIINSIGYSVNTYGETKSFTSGFSIDKELLKAYESAKGVDVTFGVAFNAYEGFSYDGTLDSFKIVAPLANAESFCAFSYKITYANDDHINDSLVIGAYAIENGKDGKALSFLNAENGVFEEINYQIASEKVSAQQ